MCSHVESIIIGLITGFFSGLAAGFVVNAIWARAERKKLDEKEDEHNRIKHILEFNEDRQLLCRYLDKLQLELPLKSSSEKHNNILRVLEEHPRTPSFKNAINQNGIDILVNIYQIENDIKNMTKFEEALYEEYKHKLFKLECDFFKAGNSILLSWDEYKENIK